jgi:heme-degrading monooxygenase HmoA
MRPYWVLWSWLARLRPLVQRNGLALRRRAMRVLRYLRMEIDPGQIAAYEEDLEEMLQLARKTPGLLGAESFRARGEPNVYLVLNEWESYEAIRSFLMLPRHVEIIRGYKRGYGEGFERRRYARLHGVRHEFL